MLDAEKSTGKKIIVTFNYRYAPKHQKIKELLIAGRDRHGHLGRLLVVPRHLHGADYFRRWHRLRRTQRLALGPQGHPPLRPDQLVARRRSGGGLGVRPLANYGKNGPFRQHQLPAVSAQDAVRVPLGHHQQPQMMDLYVDGESADGYLRDGCVFKEDVDIFDTMNAVVRYSNGVTMSYSLNAFMPIEGYRLAFNGTEGPARGPRLRAAAVGPGEETEIHLIKNFGQRGSRSRARAATAAATTSCATWSSGTARCPRTCSCRARAPARCRASRASRRARAVTLVSR